jgi:TolB-like protein/class 3 adenylate cyclase
MSTGDTRLEIGHVLFIDVVGYSKLLVKQQSELLSELNEVVSGTNEFRQADSVGKLIRLPTGDGMALVFRTDLEAPAQCAMEIARALKSHPAIQLRMGIHSGPVNEVLDVNQRANITGVGINMAQRVMDCGDAGHILLSKHVAEDLEQDERWRPLLHDLGTCEVKHSVRVGVTNLYSDEVGNSRLPKKIQASRHRKRIGWAAAAVVLLLAAIAVAILTFMRKPMPSATAAPEKSIAVLPFENLSSDKENSYFTDGVQDEILTDLAKVADLKVISRTSVMQYRNTATRNLREIGQQLGVAHLLEGSVQRAGNQVRVNAQLIDARTDAHQWAENYDRPLDDVFAIQSEIAKTIADQLQAKLSPNEKVAIEKPPTKDVTAFALYSRAKTLLLTTSFDFSQAKNFEEATENLNSAVARDPSFFAAYCQLVFGHDAMYALGYDHSPARLSLAENALQAAARLQPDAPEMHLARAWHSYYALRDYKAATAELEIARQGLANDSRIFETTGYILRRQGKQEDALRNLERAVELDPRNPSLLSQIALSYQFLRRFPEEITMLDRALSIRPNDLVIESTRGFVDLIWKADPQPLHQLAERVRTQQPAELAEVADNWFICALAERDWPAAEQALAALGGAPFWADGIISLRGHFNEGLLARAMHDEARARNAFAAARLEQEKIVQKQPDFAAAICVLGLVDAGLGDKDAALREARRAMELIPVEKDTINGQRLILYYAIIAGWVGEKDLAIQQLAEGAPTLGGSNVASYGALKLLPFWDPLRGDPRFEKIVGSLAPK